MKSRLFNKLIKYMIFLFLIIFVIYLSKSIIEYIRIQKVIDDAQHKTLQINQGKIKLSSKIEIVSLFVMVNLTDHTTNKFEITVRLRAGSNPIPFETTKFLFYTKNQSISAKLQDPKLDHYINDKNYDISDLNTSWKVIGDLDGDGISDKIRIKDKTGNVDLEVWVSQEKHSFLVSLEDYNLTAGKDVKIVDLALYDPNTEDIWGFVQADGKVLKSNTFKGLKAQITEFPVLPEHQTCTFENLIPERYFCVKVKLGKNDNSILESGEMFIILYKLKSKHRIGSDEEYGFKFIPQNGQETEFYDRTPNVLSEEKQVLYPR